MDVLFEKEEIERIVKNTSMYLKEENLITSDIFDAFNDFLTYYKTNNSLKLDSLQDEVIDNIKKIRSNVSNDIYILEKFIIENDELDIKIGNSFRNMEQHIKDGSE